MHVQTKPLTLEKQEGQRAGMLPRTRQGQLRGEPRTGHRGLTAAELHQAIIRPLSVLSGGLMVNLPYHKRGSLIPALLSKYLQHLTGYKA